jgi:hypothetical protein
MDVSGQRIGLIFKGQEVKEEDQIYHILTQLEQQTQSYTNSAYSDSLDTLKFTA